MYLFLGIHIANINVRMEKCLHFIYDKLNPHQKKCIIYLQIV